MQFFFNLEQEKLAIGALMPAPVEFSPLEVHAYVETVEFATAARDLGGHRQGELRVEQIRNLFA